MQSPEFRERYRRTRASIAMIQEILEVIDARRQEAGLSKAELARRLGANPAAIRRLLTSGASNPSLKTVLEIVDALGLELRLQTKEAGQKASEPKPRAREAVPAQPRRPASVV
jgi:transcriptional regulator with XRE-family HTH domain